MRFDELATRSVAALKDATRQASPPRVERLSRGQPAWPASVAAVGVVALVLVAVGVPAWLQSRTQLPTSDSRPALFAPPVEVASGVHRYTVQLPNGEWLTLSLPESIAREIFGFVPGATIGPSPELGYPIEVVYGTVGAVFADAEPIETLTDAAGEPIFRYRTEDDGESWAVQYGPWAVTSPERTVLSHLSGSVTREGFLLLSPSGEVSFQPAHSSPDAAFLTASGEVLIWLWHPHAGRCEGDEVGMLRLSESRSGPTALCDPVSSDTMMIGSDAFPRRQLTEIDFYVGPYPLYAGSEGSVWFLTDCPAADHPLVGTPDGLPHKGATDYEAVAALVGDEGSSVVRRNGQVWERTSEGQVAVTRVSDYMIQVTIDDASSCPAAPVVNNGVPVTFRLADS